MDYSSYRVKNLSTTRKPKNTKKFKPHKRSKPLKRQFKWGDFLVVAIIILCFTTTIMLADILSGGGLISTLSIFTNTNYTYYLVSTLETDSKYTALAESSYIVSTGGAGNLYQIEENYIVIISAYSDANSAYTVSQKNDTTQVVSIEVSMPTLTSSTDTTTEYMQTAYANIHTFLYELIDIAIAIDAGDITSSVALLSLKDTRNTLLTYISDVVDMTLDATDYATINGILQPLYGGLDAIIYDSDYTYLSGAIRNAIVTELVALENAC